MKRALVAMLAVLLTLLGTGYSGSSSLDIDEQQTEPAQLELIAPAQSATEEEGNAEPEETREPDYSSGLDAFSLAEVPPYQASPFCEINENRPFFETGAFPTGSFEFYSPLDELGRCGVTAACVGVETMPTEERGPIGMIKPSGWHTVRYDSLIEDRYLYNRCHLLGYQLTGENANERNLITGTRYLNVEGMQPFENRVAGYVRRTGERVLMRVTPIYAGDDLVATGVLMEACSVADSGKSLCFCVFVYNVQPGVSIDYATGDSNLAEPPLSEETATFEGYIGNRKSRVFHLSTCPNLPAEKNWVIFESRDAAVAAGYHACGNCRP